MQNREGQQLGNYKLVRLLGQGGFADVYLGEHIHLRTLAAVKVLKTSVVDSEEIQKFRTEARTIAELHHPNIVRVLDFAVEDSTPFLVMDYAPNGALAKRHPRGVPLSPVTVISYVAQVTAALQYAHLRGVMHLDIKPANMLGGRNNEILLSDFGIALAARTSHEPSLAGILGTLPYMAPEHLHGKPVPASDQYSLGVVVYEWLCGHPPFEGSQAALFSQHNFAAPPSLQARIPGVPPAVDQVVLRALAKDPHQRFPRVLDFAGALEEAINRSLQPPAPLVLGPVSPSSQFNQASPSSTTQQAPPVLVPPLVVGSPVHTGVPFTPTGQASEPVVSPLPEEPGVPEHPLVQQEHELVRRVSRVIHGYELREDEIQRQLNEAEQLVLAERQGALARANSEINTIRQLIRATSWKLETSSWSGWARWQAFTPAPLEIPLSNDPVVQIAACKAAAEKAGMMVERFLRRYPQPATFFKRVLFSAGGIAALLGIPSGLALFQQNPLTFLFWLLVLFLGAGAAASFLQLLPLRRADATFARVEALAERAHQYRASAIEDTYQQRLHEVRRQHEELLEQHERRWQDELAQLRGAFSAFISETGFAGAAWDNPQWETWQPQPQQAASPVGRLGSFTMYPRAGLPPLPALVSCPHGGNLLIKAAGTAKYAAIAAIQALVLRLLVTQPPGKVHFTLIDPIGLGSHLAIFPQLNDHHEILGTGRVWVDEQEIEQQLRIIMEYIRQITQQRSRGQYAAAGEAEKERDSSENTGPSHVIVVIGFPYHFTAKTANDLLIIAKNGLRCGVSSIIMGDLDLSLSALGNFDPQALEKVASVITWNGQRFTWQDADYRHCQLELDPLPAPPMFGRLVEAVHRQASLTASLEQNSVFKQMLAGTQQQAPGEKAIAWLGQPIAATAPLAATFQHELLGWPDATELGPDYAFFFDHSEGRRQQFRPYHLPAREWLEEVAARIDKPEM